MSNLASSLKHFPCFHTVEVETTSGSLGEREIEEGTRVRIVASVYTQFQRSSQTSTSVSITYENMGVGDFLFLL